MKASLRYPLPADAWKIMAGLTKVEDMSNINDTLAERHQTHGSFIYNAIHSQDLKRICHNSAHWHDYMAVQREALDYFACKIGRILSTDGRNADDWHDIAGYATLVEKWLKGEIL